MYDLTGLTTLRFQDFSPFFLLRFRQSNISRSKNSNKFLRFEENSLSCSVNTSSTLLLKSVTPSRSTSAPVTRTKRLQKTPVGVCKPENVNHKNKSESMDTSSGRTTIQRVVGANFTIEKCTRQGSLQYLHVFTLAYRSWWYYNKTKLQQTIKEICTLFFPSKVSASLCMWWKERKLRWSSSW